MTEGQKDILYTGGGMVGALLLCAAFTFAPLFIPGCNATAFLPKAAPTVEERLADNPATKALPLKIAGPETADAGTLVRLSVEGGEYPLLRWRCVPKSDNFEVVEAGKRAFFTSPAGGAFTFILTASDGKEMADAELVLTIAGPVPPGPTPPGPGPTPPPVTPLKTLAKGWLAKVNSPNKAAEAAALAMGYEAIAAQISAGALSKPDDVIAAIASKTRETLGLLALPYWLPLLEPVRTELNNRQKAGPIDYAAILRELSEALREVKPDAAPAPQPAAPVKAGTPTAKSQAQRRAA